MLAKAPVVRCSARVPQKLARGGRLEAGGQGEGELTECGGLGQASGDAGCGLAEG